MNDKNAKKISEIDNANWSDIGLFFNMKMCATKPAIKTNPQPLLNENMRDILLFFGFISDMQALQSVSLNLKYPTFSLQLVHCLNINIPLLYG